MVTVKAADVVEAVRLAQELKSCGRSHWFRGQTKNWPVRSSFNRLGPEERPKALEKVARFEEWAKHTPGLTSSASNADKIIGIAQHYGIPTNFVDFTTEPEIAAFFATEKAGGKNGEGDLACIIYVDVEDLQGF